MSWWSDVVNDIAKYGGFGVAGGAAQAAGGAGGVASEISVLSAVIAAVWANVRDGKMWRSLGWLLLGVLLILMGALILARTQAEGIARSIV